MTDYIEEMMKTPRTDAFSIEMGKKHDPLVAYRTGGVGEITDWIDFAKQLERELNTWKASREDVERQQWIPVSEQFPPDMCRVLAYYPKMVLSPIAVGWTMKRDDGRIYGYGNSSGHEASFPSSKFTHWMPLPNMPRGTSPERT